MNAFLAKSRLCQQRAGRIVLWLPHLTMIILQDQERYCFVESPEQWRLADIYVSAGIGNNKATIILLRPLHMLTDSPCVPLAAQQLAHQMRTKWLGMSTFCVGRKGLPCVSNRELDPFGIELISQLVKGTWTSLQHLSLSGCKLKAHEFWLLSQGNFTMPRVAEYRATV